MECFRGELTISITGCFLREVSHQICKTSSQKASSPHNSCTIGLGCVPTSSPILMHVFHASRHVHLWLDRSYSHRYCHHSLSNLCTASAWTYSLQLGNIGWPWSTVSVDTLGRLESPIQLPATCFHTWKLGSRTLAGCSFFALTTARNFVPSSLSYASPAETHTSPLWTILAWETRYGTAAYQLGNTSSRTITEVKQR